MNIAYRILLSVAIASAGFVSASAQGATDAAAQIITTTITDGEFAPDTNWYTIQIGTDAKYWRYVTSPIMSLKAANKDYDDADLWCFVGNNDEGYSIYNKVAGTSKMLAAPTEVTGDGGAAWVYARATGDASMCYKWQFRPTDILGADTPAYLVNEFGETDKTINNNNSRLAFLTTGVNANSAIQVKWAEKTVSVGGTDNGKFANATSTVSKWYASWTHNEDKVGFGTDVNNMQPASDNSHIKMYTGTINHPWSFFAPDGWYVSGYEFDFCKDGDFTEEITLSCGDMTPVAATAEKQHFAVKDLKEDASSDLEIKINPTANKGILVTGMTITCRRGTVKEPGTVVFRYDGTNDYKIIYRIPVITTIDNGPHKGRVLAISDYRYSGYDIGNGRIDLYMSYSDDNGKTWSTPDHLRDAAGNPVAQGTGKGTVATSLENPDCGFGDGAMVCDRETGKVLLVSVCGRTPFFSARRNNPNQVARWYSEDGGDTWTEFTNITDRIYPLFDGTVPNGYIDGMFFGSGRLMQSRKVKVGDYYRVYGVLSGYHAATGNLSNWVMYTDDFGETWHILGDPMTPPVASNGDEPKAEELPDGSVLLAARRTSGNRHFNIFRYSDIDKGEGAWDTLVATDMGMGTIAACDGEIMILPVRNVSTGQQAYMALQSFPYGGSRRNVSIAWKVLDEGADIATPEAFREWDGRLAVSKIGSGYSTMAWQHDNTLGFLYEEETFGKQYCQVYRNLTIQEITGGAYEYCPDVDGAVAAALRDGVVDYRLGKSQKGEYVGQPDDNPDAGKAASDYHNGPSAESYMQFNKALDSAGRVISIVDGGVYTLKSAHNGKYDFGDRWLTSDGVNLKSVSEPTDATVFTFVQKEGTKEWVIYHPATRTYVGQSPAATETAFTVTADPAGAHGYIAESTRDGYTSLSDSNPGATRYAAIHQGGNNNGHIVIWVPEDQGSKWYMKFDHMAVGEELPGFKSGITDIVQDVTENVRYYDITGREVHNPVRGQFLITSDRRKIVY